MHDILTGVPHGHTHSQNRFAVIPTREKLGSDRRFTGRGVTIAFLDSGFYPHPDIAGRVIAFHDVTDDERSFNDIRKPAGHHWHGTQTAVTCAGDGKLSDGVYHGPASAANLVLVKVSKAGRITDESIQRGLNWVIANRERYNIRILNMSLGGDADLPTHESCINRHTEHLVASGVVVTVAAGNSAERRPIPPANSPSAITVGGYSDENQFAIEGFDLYHSSFGETADRLVKPEIIAPAMFVAAPILPGTQDYKAAEALSVLSAAPDYDLVRLLAGMWRDAGLGPDLVHLDPETARKAVEDELHRRKIVATHYQHVDGTSFAAPITAAVVSQMIEANPRLTPAAIKNILISTAIRLGGRPSIRQGFGVLNARLAIENARSEEHPLTDESYFPPRVEGKRILFAFHDDDARSVALTGDFNGWSRDEVMLRRTEHGIWHAEIPCQPAGEYRYKFLIDGARWTEDPSHGLKADDGLGGFNSILVIG